MSFAAPLSRDRFRPHRPTTGPAASHNIAIGRKACYGFRSHGARHEPARENRNRRPDRHLGRGMAGPNRSRRRVPAVRALRLGRPDLQSLLDAGAGRAEQVPDEAARAAVDRGHRLQPPQGRHERRPRRAVGRQPAGLHLARRRAQGPRRRQLRGARPHRDRHGAGGAQERPADDFAAGDPLLSAHRLPPLRGHHRGFQRARAHPQGARAATARWCCRTTAC